MLEPRAGQRGIRQAVLNQPGLDSGRSRDGVREGKGPGSNLGGWTARGQVKARRQGQQTSRWTGPGPFGVAREEWEVD